MKITTKILIMVVAAAMLIAPSLVQAETVGTVVCTPNTDVYIGYDCIGENFNTWFFTIEAARNYLLPSRTEISPEYTFVSGASTETFTP